MLLPTVHNPPSSRWLDPKLLDRLSRARRPWDAASRRIVDAALADFERSPVGTFVEIGAGDGQLRDWLPPAIAARTVHSEPSIPFLHFLRQRHPFAETICADAATLPFPDRSLAGVIGLCVLDAVTNLTAVRDECRRVLQPGGVIVHFLDLSTNPDACFAQLIENNELPVPNFTQEPGLLDELPADDLESLPRTDSFDEVLAIPREPFLRLVETMRSSGHPLVDRLGFYSRLHELQRLDPFTLGQQFMSVRSDSDRLREVNHALLTLALLARRLGRRLPMRPVSLRAHFRARLKAAFASSQGFEVKFAGPLAVRETSHDDRYVVRHAGRTLSRQRPIDIPGTLIDDLSASEVARPWRATTIESFIAQRII